MSGSRTSTASGGLPATCCLPRFSTPEPSSRRFGACRRHSGSKAWRSRSSASSGRGSARCTSNRRASTTTNTATTRDPRASSSRRPSRPRAPAFTRGVRAPRRGRRRHPRRPARGRPLPRARLARHARRRMRHVRAARRTACRARRLVAASVRARLREGGARSPSASRAGDARPPRRSLARGRRDGGGTRDPDRCGDRGDGRRGVGSACRRSPSRRSATARGRRTSLTGRTSCASCSAPRACVRRGASSSSRRTSTTSRPSSFRTRSSAALRPGRSTSGPCRCR